MTDKPRCPLRMAGFDQPDTCDKNCAWLLKNVNGCGYCAIAVWAARQDNLPLEECMRFNYMRLEDE